MPLTLILAVGWDPVLLDTRCSILRDAGYFVESVPSIQQAINYFRAGGFDLVILCHSIPLQERKRLISSIRASGAATPIISLVAFANPASDGLSDAMIESVDPRELLHGIQETLHRVAKQTSVPRFARSGQ